MMIELFDASYQYPNDSRFTLHPLSIKIEDGEVLAVAGKSGSGKTTLLKLLAGLDDLSTGRIEYGGEPLPLPSSKLVKGYNGFTIVHQDSKLFPRYTVEQNILHPLRRLPADIKQERLEELLLIFDIVDIREARIVDISGGQKQRTSIATALAGSPEVLIMDEPFSHLDQFNKRKLIRALKKYIRTNEVTTIVSSHDPEDILGLADRVAIFAEGQLVNCDSPQRLYYDIQDQEVARLFGELNEIPKTLWDHYKFDGGNKQNAFIRPSDLLLDDSSVHKARIKEILFSGWYWQLVLEDNHMEWILYHQGENKLKVGQEVGFTLPESKIAYI